MRFANSLGVRRARVAFPVICFTLGPLLAAQSYGARVIYQWEWIDPLKPQLGTRRSSTFCLDGRWVETEPVPELAGKDLTKAFLVNANLDRGQAVSVRFVNADLTKASFVNVDLSQANLLNANLSNANLTGARLSFATLTGANLTGATITGAGFIGVSGFTSAQLYSTDSYKKQTLTNLRLNGLDLRGWDFSNQNLGSTVFSTAYIASASFANASINFTSFDKTNLTQQQLSSTASYRAHDLHGISLALNSLYGWDFSNQNLSSANFLAANLTNANFSNAVISGADFSTLPGNMGISYDQFRSTANFRNRDLKHVKLVFNDLSGWDLSNMDLTAADFSTADLSRATLTGSTILAASLGNITRFGFTPSQFYSTASYQTRKLGGIQLFMDDLTDWDFSNLDLTSADFHEANLTHARFDGAIIRGASFRQTTQTGFTAQQLYRTANYLAGDLRSIDLQDNSLRDWSFSNQNLTGAKFRGSDLTGADFTGALLVNTQLASCDLTDADFTGADLRGCDIILRPQNAILPDGTINKLNLKSGKTLSLHDSNPLVADSLSAATSLLASASESEPITTASTFSVVTAATTPPPVNPKGIRVLGKMHVDPGGRLAVFFDDATWDSTLRFDKGISVELGGNLMLGFEEHTDPSRFTHTSWRLFDWTGVYPFGQFDILSSDPNLHWDVSKLYSTGVVTLVAVPEPSLMVGAMTAFAMVVAARTTNRRR